MADKEVKAAASMIRQAEALMITAGAGMGVDSGLPDFRGKEGFWNAYPAYRHLGLQFDELANPRWFRDDPELAWGFYGHRLHLYRSAQPHPGFASLRRWGDAMPYGVRVFTSNVDGHFQSAGFAEEVVYEVHGSIHHAQCINECGVGIFPADGFEIPVDGLTFRATSLPRCLRCGSLARPNILMFNDCDWDSSRSERQRQRQEAWMTKVRAWPMVVIELGAGTAIPTVRRFSETASIGSKSFLIRINPRDPRVPPGNMGLSMGALAGLQAIDAELRND